MRALVQQHGDTAFLPEHLQLVFTELISAKNVLLGALMCSKGRAWPSEMFQPVPSGGSERILEKCDLAAARMAEMAEQAEKPWGGTAAAVMPEPLPCNAPLPCKAKAAVLLCDRLPASLGTQAMTAGCEQGVRRNPAHLTLTSHLENCPAG